MHFPPYVLVGLGGAIGSVLRWMISIRLDDSLGSLPLGREGFAWPTLIVNILGCLAMVFIADIENILLMCGISGFVGVLGGFTTFSTFMMETSWQIQAQNWPYIILYVLGTFGACYAATAYALKKI
jgi:fluoride exporter